MISQFPTNDQRADPDAAEEPETTRLEIGVRLVSEPASLWWVLVDLIGAISSTYLAITTITDGKYLVAAPWTVLALFMALELSRDAHGY